MKAYGGPLDGSSQRAPFIESKCETPGTRGFVSKLYGYFLERKCTLL